ncbi:MAG: threonylcarbamoyl-AMP synthase [Bacteroidetes bacterium]|nr:threonylcarbamoyl-AMP synthase [Bacteroidota bacterium]
MLVEINPYHLDSRLIDEAVSRLKNGEIIIFPTDSLYAMGCDLRNKKAIQELVKLRGIKSNKINFSLVCSNLAMVANYTKQLDRPVFKLMKHHLPGPFTFILTANNDIPRLFDSNKKEVGIRIPDNSIILSIIEKLGNPVVATSLHNEGDPIQPFFYDPRAIFEHFEFTVPFIIDGGIGHLEGSTVVDCRNGIEIIRQGIGDLNY